MTNTAAKWDSLTMVTPDGTYAPRGVGSMWALCNIVTGNNYQSETGRSVSRMWTSRAAARRALIATANQFGYTVA